MPAVLSMFLSGGIRENLLVRHFQLLEAAHVTCPQPCLEPAASHLLHSSYTVTSPSACSMKMLSDLKDSRLAWAQLDNPRYSPHLKVLTLIISTKSLEPCKEPYHKYWVLRSNRDFWGEKSNYSTCHYVPDSSGFLKHCTE